MGLSFARHLCRNRKMEPVLKFRFNPKVPPTKTWRPELHSNNSSKNLRKLNITFPSKHRKVHERVYRSDENNVVSKVHVIFLLG